MVDKKQLVELDVERINIVDNEGKVQMVLTNAKRMPDPVVLGKNLQRNAPPSAGIIFYNQDGDECGGLVFGNEGGALLFDAYQNDQVLGLTYFRSEDGKDAKGVYIWDRPEPLTPEILDELQEVGKLEDGAEKKQRLKHLMESGVFGFSRLFVGKNAQGESTVNLRDSQGRDRIRLRVDAEDVPRLEFLDEDGVVTYSIPPKEEKIKKP